MPATDVTGLAGRCVGSVQLVFVDANPERGGQADLEGILAPATVAAIAWRIDAHSARSALFVHYPPLAQEAPRAGVCAGGEALHRVLAARSGRLHGVFVGHNHRALHHLRDGVLNASAPAPSRQFLPWPGQAEMAAAEEAVAGLHCVTLEPSGTPRVQYHAFVSARSKRP